MSISRTLMVTLNQDKATTEDKFYIYRDDVGVDIYVVISNLEYQFNKKKNGYKKADVLLKTPSGDIYKVENLQIRETKIKFSFTQDIVDKMQEIGKYELQFQLYDNALNRISLPPYKLEVKEPFEVPTEDEEARVEYSRVGYAHVFKDTVDLFAIEDGYIKTTWQTGDLITASRLNNLEEGVEYLFTQIENTGSSSNSQAISRNTRRITKLEKEVSTFKESIDKTNTEITQVKDMLDELLYKPISITSFSASPSTAEIGSVVTTLTLTWSYSKEIEWQKLDGVEIDKTIRKTTYNNITSNKNYSIQANDGKTTASRSAGISFMNGKYTGVATEGIYDNSFILKLSKTLTTSKNGSFTVNCGEGQYIFFAIPTRFGVPKFSVGGFEGGFELVATIDFTNSSNYTEPYYVYKSENSNLGNTTVNVG